MTDSRRANNTNGSLASGSFRLSGFSGQEGDNPSSPAFQFKPILIPQHAEGRVQKLTIATAATFTADLIGESLAFWMDELGIPAAVEFAPYNEAFQQFLSPDSLLGRNQQGVNVVLARLEDWRDRIKGPPGWGTGPAPKKRSDKMRDIWFGSWAQPPSDLPLHA